MVATVVGPTLQPIRETFDVGLAQVGLLFPFASLGYIGSGLLGSIASDRYARRPFVVAGSALMAAGVGIQSTAPTWSLLLAGTLVIGMGMGLLDGPLNALIMDLSTSDTAKWLNYLHFFFGTGALAGPILAGAALGLGADWRQIYAVLGIVAATAVIPFALMRIPARPRRAPVRLGSVGRIALRPLIILMMIVLVFYVGVEVTIAGWLPSFLELDHGFNRGVAGAAVSVFWVGILIGRLSSGLLTRWMDPLRLLTLSLAVGSFFALAASLIDNSILAIVCFAVVGIMLASAFPTALAVGVKSQEAATGALTGFMVAAAGVGSLTFPPIAGAIGESFGLRPAMVMTAGLTGLAGVASAWAMVRSGRATTEGPTTHLERSDK